MCGIAGIIQQDGGVARRDLERMAERQRHRGPDDDGVWTDADGRAGLSHRRLSVIAPGPDGRQPMTSAEHGHHLVHNGEIYNFRELRAELERRGHHFATRTDTEVILHGYREWGDAVVPRLHGMFAIAVWDAPRRRLLLARDRLGIKPLHWANGNGAFTFASELKGVLAGPTRERDVDASAIWDFLTYRYVPAPKTAYRGVHKLPPGHTLVLQDGVATLRSYWDLSFSASARGDEETAHELRALVTDCVRSHLVSDVPLGVLLSGGIDSSAITAFASETRRGISSYAVGFGGTSVSEAPFAREAARRFHTTHTEIEFPAEETFAQLDLLPEWFDEPFGDTSALPTELVCRVARRGVTVALSGDGGDELFGGYRRYGKFCRWRAGDVLPQPVRRPLGGALGRAFPPWSRGRRALVRWAMEDVGRHAALHGGMTREDKRSALPAEILRRFERYDDYWSFRRHWREDLDPWSRLQYVDLKTYLPDDLLTKVDRVSMRSALEVRPPFLDHRVVEFAATIPTAQRVPGGERKHILKRALAGILGPESLDRGKQGFSLPLDRRVGDERPESRSWPVHHRLTWALLARWTHARLGVADPREVLREAAP